jgi:hypothetical protein
MVPTGAIETQNGVSPQQRRVMHTVPGGQPAELAHVV